MDINILVGGQAGQGVAKISEVLGKSFTKIGYYVFNYRDYQSLIKGGHNFNILRISDKWIGSYLEKFDFILPLDQNTIDVHFNKLKESGYVIADRRIKAKRKIEIDTGEVLKKANASKISENIVLISALWKILGLPKEILKEEIKKKIGGEQNLRIIEEVFNLNLKPLMKLEVKKPKKYFLNGSEGVALGSIASGIDLYFAYPMTPATPILHILAKYQDKYGLRVYQPENEIAVINMALGSSYSGAKVMVGTSGGGFALMVEALSLQGMSEVPLVVYLAMRYAPATGIPTYTSQGDLFHALFSGHGEFPRVVVAPGDSMEAFRRTVESFYLAYKYRILSIILSDKHLAESYFTFDELEKTKDFVTADRFLELDPEEDYKYYKLSEDGISPRAIPGIKDNVIVKANSYEHDEFGITTEEAEWAVKMSEKRWKKFEKLREEVEKLDPYKLYNPDGEKLIVSWGSTKGAILDFIRENKDYAFLQICYLSPFSKKIKDILEKYEKKILVENNVTGLLGKLIKMETGIEIEKKILKYDARPFTKEYLEKALKINNF